MLKTNVLFPKRSKPIVQEEEMLEVQSGPRKMPLQVVNRQNTSKCIFQNSKNEQKWDKKKEEDLMISFFQKIVDEPYLSFTWSYFQDQENLMKISREMQRSVGSCSRIIEEIKNVNEQKYSGLKFVDFLIVYWKGQEFRNKIGRDLIEKIRGLKRTKSDHMKMIEQKMDQMKAQQPSLDKLYELIMRN